MAGRVSRETYNIQDPQGRHSRCVETVPTESFFMVDFSSQTESELLFKKVLYPPSFAMDISCSTTRRNVDLVLLI